MSFFQNTQGVNISDKSNFNHNGSITNFHGGGKDGLKYLNKFISSDAQFDSSAQYPSCQCHPGTRENVLKRLRDWVDDPSSKERILWLYGPAGAGKSAIAQTIACSYSRPKAAATFCFFRSDVNRNDDHLLFTTLAYQIASSMPEMNDYIAHSLLKFPDLPRKDVETQFNQLLAQPFQVLSDEAEAAHQKYQKLAPVIIIDGVDECTDENLQRQFLEVIGNAVKNDRSPLRFLIVSQPEFQIEKTISCFQPPALRTDLAKLDDTNKDIKKYLVYEFSRIASKQGLDPAWPGNEIIDDIVRKSFENFFIASFVIKFVGDPSSSANTQLDIVLNNKPHQTMSPFAILDRLFFEILKQVPDQDFLKRYLALLVARNSVSSDYADLYKDDATLMHVSQSELRANRWRMRPLLGFDANIRGIRGYLEVFIDSLVRVISVVIEHPDHHGSNHFAPQFGMMIQRILQTIKLDIEDWEKILRPLLDSLDKLPSKINSLKNGYCRRCQFFQITRDILAQSKEVPVVEKYLVYVGEIIRNGEERNFDLNFGRHVFGSAVIVGLVMAILVHWR